LLLVSVVAEAGEVVDGAGRTVEIPDTVTDVICSGAGCLRLLTYLQAQDKIVAVDDIEKRRQQLDARPYAIANPQFETYPIFGEFRGRDNPERILTLSPQPQVIFKTYSQMGYDPEELQQKTGIPVVVLRYGNLTDQRDDFYNSLRIMAGIVNKIERAEQVIAFIEEEIQDLRTRTEKIAEANRPSVYLGGVAFKGPHGFESTEPSYPPFVFLQVRNLAAGKIAGTRELSTSNVSKEQILAWNPEYLFLDLSTIRLGNDAGGLYELRKDPAYQTLTAIKAGRVFGLLPYNMYTSNHGSTIANSYYIGKILYPESFDDIEPARKADEIFTFLVGKPVFVTLNEMFNKMIYSAVEVNSHAF
jgi:iron complex transport system substrate-binding protein